MWLLDRVKRSTIQWSVLPKGNINESKTLRSLLKEGTDVNDIYEKLYIQFTFLTSNKLAIVRTSKEMYPKILNAKSPCLYAEEIGKFHNGNKVRFDIYSIWNSNLGKVLNGYITVYGDKKESISGKTIVARGVLLKKELVFRFPESLITNAVIIQKRNRRSRRLLGRVERELGLKAEIGGWDGYTAHDVYEYEKKTGLPASLSTNVAYTSEKGLFEFSVANSEL